MNLSDHDKELIKKLIEAGKPLPDRYRSELFEDATELELIWLGKTTDVTNVVLPLLSIEQVGEPCREEQASSEEEDRSGSDKGTGQRPAGWSNKLILGDNRLVLSSLKDGLLREQIEQAGGLKAVYIDPPFDVGADFSYRVEIGDDLIVRFPAVIEEVAYRDSWGAGQTGYLNMIAKRLKLIHGLLAADGCLVIHIDWRVNSSIRLILDEIFGRENHRNEIVWSYRTGGASKKEALPRKHDTIYLYSKSAAFNVNYMTERQYLSKAFMGSKVDSEGRHYVDTILRDVIEGELKLVIDNSVVSFNVRPVLNLSSERLAYDTQKPEGLLALLLRITTKPGDLIADFFCGSGTTLAVAEKTGRKWIGCDLGRFAVHTSRKRLIDVQRQLRAEDKPYRAFEILTPGRYERQFFAGINPNLPEEEKIKLATQQEEQYLHLILTAYKAERSLQMPPFHGRRGATMVIVGPLDAPVTQSIVHDAVSACQQQKISKVDILGFEFEMGLLPDEVDRAREKGVDLKLSYIPSDVFDKRAVDKGQLTFYDVACLEVQPVVDGQKVRVELKYFGVFYRQDDDDEKIAKLKKGSSRVIIRSGQVMKITKDKNEVVTEEVLTKKWSDWIDYWAVDFDYSTRPEQVRIQEGDEERLVSTGSCLFASEWQSFRTRKDRTLELSSAVNEYPKKGRKYTIAVKVIDIFGNDTTRIVEVKV